MQLYVVCFQLLESVFLSQYTSVFWLYCCIWAVKHSCHVHACCSGKVNVIKFIFNKATLHTNPSLLRSPSGNQSCLSALYDALIMRDSFGGNTPLHLCLEMLSECSDIGPSNSHFCCVNTLLDFIEGRQQRLEQCTSFCLLPRM